MIQLTMLIAAIAPTPRPRWRLLWLAALVGVMACGGPIQRSLDESTPTLKDLRTVREDPNKYEGMYVVFGGEIVTIRSEGEGTALVVVEQPLSMRQRPQRSQEGVGRVVVWYGDYLDPYLFRRGRRITVGGVVGGTRVEPVGEVMHPHTLVYGKEIHLWKEPDWPLIADLKDPRQWYPWWYDPYYGARPWWW